MRFLSNRPDGTVCISRRVQTPCARLPSFRPFGTGFARFPANLLCRFEQEPGPSLSLIDPILDQTGRGDVVVLVTNLVGGA
jgi:hypothetical protein